MPSAVVTDEQAPTPHAISIVSGYEDVRAVLRDPVVFSTEGDAIDCGQQRPLIPLQSPPEEHSRYRSVLEAAFSPKVVAALDSELRRHANHLIDGFAGDGRVEFNAAFSRPFPVLALLALLDLPVGDRDRIRAFHDRILHPGDVGDLDVHRRRVGEEVYRYFEPVVAARRDDPGGALISALQHPEGDGEPFSDDEVVDVCYLLVLAGIDPVGGALAGIVAYLGADPVLRTALLEDPASLRRAIEELLRWGSSVKAIARVVTTAATVDGYALSPGDRIGCALSAANRDPALFDRPDVVDLERRGTPHLTFGVGPHHCVGAHLARLQLRVALEELHRRLPDHRLDPAADARVDPATIGAHDELHLVFTADGAPRR